MKKRILIISYSYPPSNAPAAQRPYSFAKYLDKEKYYVDVLTCSNQDSSLGFDKFNGDSLKDVNLIKVKSFGLTSFRDIKKSSMATNKESTFLGKIKSKLFSFFSKLIFPDKGVFWILYLIPYVVKNSKSLKADVIFSTSPLFSNHLAAKVIKLINPKAIHISDFRDYHFVENHSSSKFKNLLNSRLEQNVIKDSNIILFISEGMRNVYSEVYQKYSKKFKTIYNGFDLDEFTEIKKQVNKNKLTIFYAGSFYRGVRSPRPLLVILESLLNKGLIEKGEFEIQIAGNLEKELLPTIHNLEVYKNISFLGLIPRKEVLKKYVNSHVLWLIVGNKINHFSGVPIKMYEYMGARRPILNFAPLESESTRIIEELNIGWSLTNNEADLNIKEEVVLDIFKEYRKGKLANQLNKNLSLKYLRKSQTKLLENIIDQYK